MSMELYTYLGVYVEGRMKPVPSKETWFGCPKCEKPEDGIPTGASDKGLFCSDCGTKLEEFSKDTVKYTNLYDLTMNNDFEEVLECEFFYHDHPILEENDERKFILLSEVGGFYIEIEPGDFIPLQKLEELNPRELIDEFKTKYKDFFEFLETHVDDFNVGYGIVSYYS